MQGDIAPFAKGYRECIGDASCETGDKCVFGAGGIGDTGSCQKR